MLKEVSVWPRRSTKQPPGARHAIAVDALQSSCLRYAAYSSTSITVHPGEEEEEEEEEVGKGGRSRARLLRSPSTSVAACLPTEAARASLQSGVHRRSTDSAAAAVDDDDDDEGGSPSGISGETSEAAALSIVGGGAVAAAASSARGREGGAHVRMC